MRLEGIMTEIGEIRNLPPGWDGESENPTNPACLDAAARFAGLLRPEHAIPKLSAATGDEVAFYWDKDGYVIFHFLPDGTVRHYDDLTGETGFSTFGNSIPEELDGLIPRASC